MTTMAVDGVELAELIREEDPRRETLTVARVRRRYGCDHDLALDALEELVSEGVMRRVAAETYIRTDRLGAAA